MAGRPLRRKREMMRRNGTGGDGLVRVYTSNISEWHRSIVGQLSVFFSGMAVEGDGFVDVLASRTTRRPTSW
jgi:hypothetical protein